jgi:GNAT superfamily N-acetyltransferase
MRPKKTPASISYREMKSGEEAIVVDLVLKIFDEFVAPQYTQEGVVEFKKFVRIDALADRLRSGNIVLLAELEKRIIGIIEIRENSHIALLFVDKSMQRKGIAKELIRKSINMCKERKPSIEKITVNSSPNAFTGYQNIGFKKVEDEKAVNGIRFIPMELILSNHD